MYFTSDSIPQDMADTIQDMGMMEFRLEGASSGVNWREKASGFRLPEPGRKGMGKENLDKNRAQQTCQKGSFSIV